MASRNDTAAMDMLGKLITEQLIDDGVPQPEALIAAAHIIERLQEVRGGTELYIPSVRQRREAEILRDWQQGVKPQTIADTRGVNVSTVYRIINRPRGAPDESHDDDGFGSPDWNL